MIRFLILIGVEEKNMLLRNNKAFRNLFFGRISSVFADAIMFFSLLKWVELQTGDSDSFPSFFLVFFYRFLFLPLLFGQGKRKKFYKRVLYIQILFKRRQMFFF